MMPVLIGIAFKSLLIASLTLGLLQLMNKRSAAERSWVAHVGLLALVIMAFAPLVLPSWNVEAPALFTSAPAAATPSTAATLQASPVAPAVPAELNIKAVKTIAPALTGVLAKSAAPRPAISATAATVALYAVPAAILLFITLLALARLVTLRARAEVLVDGHWLSALARAQRRMGFKHGTALLVSDDLASPISWGLMRPVIVLNARAVEASSEAEAIIAHELAHVARMDWVKLLLARVATALFWFNPLVWVLAREAHQLREEAADDAVLAADIADTDYAQLLVGVARHECRGLLLGAHGVAPSKNSLARRVARVLDVKSVRGPAARPFAAGVLVGAVVVAAPLAAVTLTSAVPKAAKSSSASIAAIEPITSDYATAPATPADLPHLIADGVATAVTVVARPKPDAEQVRARAIAETVASASRAKEAALANAAQASAHARLALAEAAKDVEHARNRETLSKDEVNRVIQMKAVGITPDYVNAMQAASPALRSIDPAKLFALKSIGVDPSYVRDMADAGLRNLDEEDLIKAKSIGLTPNYVRGLTRAGLRPDIDEFVQLRSVGVPVDYVASFGKSDRRVDADKVLQMWAVGVKPEDLAAVPAPPKPPVPPPPKPPRAPAPHRMGRPASSPSTWNVPPPTSNANVSVDPGG